MLKRFFAVPVFIGVMVSCVPSVSSTWLGFAYFSSAVTVVSGEGAKTAEPSPEGEPRGTEPPEIGAISDRSDRLIKISGKRTVPMKAEFSVDDGKTWRPATIYTGTTVDEWRGSNHEVWNRAAIDGQLPAGGGDCLWNYAFDLELPIEFAAFRLSTAADGTAVFEQTIDFTAARETVLIDRRNVAELAGGKLPARWSLVPAGKKSPAVASIHCTVEKEFSPLVMNPNLKGWYRIYVGMEPYSTFRFHLSEVDARYAVPNYYAKPNNKDRFAQEFFVCSADMTGQKICVDAGGSRFWRDVSIRYIRLVPMSEDEVSHFQHVRQLARTKGRPFAGYLEPCTPAYYEPESLKLRDHIRNEMKLNQIRGSTDVYVHVIRIGSKAWYHSDVVERFTDWPPTWPSWMKQGDPLAVAVEEARQAGLKILPDAGMNSTYYGAGGEEYGVLTDGFVNRHPEYLCPKRKGCFDYRHEEVRKYVASIVRELITKYDVDGVNLDFGRWGYRPAYDEASLVAVLTQIDEDRRAAAKKWGHPVLISARVDYDAPPAEGAQTPVFVAALRSWAKAGLVDRIMINLDEKLSASIPLEHYLDAIQGTRTELWGDMYWGTWHKGGGPAQDLSIARNWVDRGLSGGLFYYMRVRPIEFEQINWQMRLIDFPEISVGPADR